MNSNLKESAEPKAKPASSAKATVKSANKRTRQINQGSAAQSEKAKVISPRPQGQKEGQSARGPNATAGNSGINREESKTIDQVTGSANHTNRAQN